MGCIKHYAGAAFALFLAPLLWAGPAAAADCGLDLKPSDDYQALTAKLKCLENRIKALEGGAASTPANAAPAPRAAPSSQEAAGLRIEAESCEKKGKSIACKMFVTSQDEDKMVTFFSKSMAVDRNGVQYRGLGYQGVGETRMETNAYSTSRNYIADVRTACVMVFEAAQDVKADAIAAVQLYLEASGQETAITLRNIPFR